LNKKKEFGENSGILVRKQISSNEHLFVSEFRSGLQLVEHTSISPVSFTNNFPFWGQKRTIYLISTGFRVGNDFPDNQRNNPIVATANIGVFFPQKIQG